MKVGLEVVPVEISEEVFAQVLAQRLLNEAQVCLQRGVTEGDAEEVAGTGNDIILKPFAFENRNDVVFVGNEGELVQRLADLGEVLL